MKGDFSLDLSLRAQRYSSVRFQQGRVLTDSDWNEQVEIVNLRAERQAEDVIGDCGVPMDASGFGVRATTTALSIHAVSSDEACVVGEDGAIFLLTAGSPDAIALQATVPPDAGRSHLRGVHFPEVNQGYAVGDRGTLLSITLGSPGPVIARLALKDVTVGLRAVHFVSSTQGFAVGEEGTILFITTSGTGATAEKVAVPAGVTGCLHAVHFISATEGFAVGDDGTILALTAGSPGPVATRIDIPGVLAADLYAVHFVNRDQGYAVGKDGTILFIDRNASPGAAKLTAPAVTSHLRAVRFVNTQGYAVGDDATIVSIDISGATPILKKVMPPPGVDAGLRGTAFLTPAEACAVGEDGTVLLLQGLVPRLLSPLPAASLKLSAGRFYSHGTLCELREEATYLNQPYSAGPPALAPGTHLLYLDAWQRHVTYVEDPEILEVALGGPDTTTRTQTIAQVKVLKLDSLSPPESWNCLSGVAEWDALTAPRRARLRARARSEESPSNVCELPARAGFRRLENQLYRVEIHAADPASATFTFKWSRENGSVTYPVAEIAEDAAKSQTVVTVRQRGRDPNLDLSPENWVEIVDDELVLANRPGRLLEYEKDGNDPLEIVLKGLLGAGFTAGRDPKRHPLLRRWDHRAPTGGEGAVSFEEGKWLDLEDGVQVYFEPGGDYRPGDYWLIPARSLKADVVWPVDECGAPEALPPRGIHHAYCRLALVDVAPDSSVTVLSDCRPEFPALTELTQLYYVSGDGQDGPPGVLLPQRLVVRVANGQHPVVGARVRFAVDQGNGSLVSPGSFTDTSGLADCGWVLDANPLAAARRQRVRADLLDAESLPIAGQVVTFCATATLQLQYVSGDGQETRPGNLLDHPLEVRVVNGQSPVANARVRFTTPPIGGGSLSGVNPVTTVADGMARINWRLGNAGPQRVVADLIDGLGAVVQSVAFNATLSIASEVAYTPGCDYLVGKATTVQEALDALCNRPDAGGHCVTIGKGGQVEETLTDAVLERLLQERQGRLCLCFLPGNHEVGRLSINGSGKNYRLSIKGCGHTAVVMFKEQATFNRFASIELADFSLVCGETAGLAFTECSEVRIAEMVIEARIVADKTPLLRFAGGGDITVSGCDIHAKGRSQEQGIAVVFEDAKGVVRFNQNDVRGTVSFYGQPGTPGALEKFVRDLAKRIDKVKLAPSSRSAFFAGQNNFDWLTIGAEKVKQLKSSSAIPGVLETVKLTDNVFRAGGNIALGAFVTVNASLFMDAVKDDGAGTLGSAIGISAWGIDNDSPLANNTNEMPAGPVLNLLASRRIVSAGTRSYLNFGNMVRVEMM